MAPNRGELPGARTPAPAPHLRGGRRGQVGVSSAGGAPRAGPRLNAGHPSPNESDGAIGSYGRGCAFWPSFELLPDDDGAGALDPDDEGAGALHPDDDGAGALGGGA